MTESSTLTRGERTRQAILDAAERLIMSQGYHGTSMRQIAEGAGIAVGGIYNHFESKETIFAALLERHQPYSDIVAGLSKLSAQDEVELLEGAARLIINKALANRVFIRLAFVDMQEFDGDTVFHFATQMIQGLAAFFAPLRSSGKLRDDIPLAVMVRSFAGLVISFIFTEIVAFSDGSPRVDLPVHFHQEIDWIAGMVDLYLNGVANKEHGNGVCR